MSEESFGGIEVLCLGWHRERMALILMCGLPASGKSTVADKLKQILQQEGQEVYIIRDGEDAIGPTTDHNSTTLPSNRVAETRASLYCDSATEKKTRARLRAATERALNAGNIVICDSLNYIKGFRYEMYCVAKTASLKYCVVYCDPGEAQCISHDVARGGRGEDAYGESLCNALTRRFEVPVARNRWDSPLHVIDTTKDGWDTSLLAVRDLVLKKSLKLIPTRATRVSEKQGADVLGLLDRVTRELEALMIAEMQGGKGVGDKIIVQNASNSIRLERKPKVAEVRNMRRSYLTLARMHPPKGNSKGELLDEYIEYINAQLRVV